MSRLPITEKMKDRIMKTQMKNISKIDIHEDFEMNRPLQDFWHDAPIVVCVGLTIGALIASFSWAMIETVLDGSINDVITEMISKHYTLLSVVLVSPSVAWTWWLNKKRFGVWYVKIKFKMKK